MRFRQLLTLVIASSLGGLAVGCGPEEVVLRRAPGGTAVNEAPAPSGFHPAVRPSEGDWNAAQIEWLSHADALARARSSPRPIVVVMHADWCGHCRNYEHVFADPRIVEASRRFYMVKVDVDHERTVADLYTRDGGYVPRTYFLDAAGTILDVDADRPRFRYFFDESDPSSLRRGMDAALAL